MDFVRFCPFSVCCGGNFGDGLVVSLWPITLATRVRFLVRAVRQKSMRVSEVSFYLPLAIPHARYGGIQKGLVEMGEYLCLHCFL